MTYQRAFGDRVKETTTVTGTGAVTLGGAATGYQTFESTVGRGGSCFYCIYDSTNLAWEIGIGTFGGTGSKGYVSGGATNSSPAGYETTTDLITFSTDTRTTPGTAALSSGLLYLAGLGADGTKGYLAGGQSNNTITPVNGAYKIVVSTDTLSSQASANLTVARFSMGTLSECTSKGYFIGGSTNNAVVTTDKTTFSGDTTAAATTANLTVATTKQACVSDGNTKGFVLAGETPIFSSTTAEKLVYSTDVMTSNTTTNLPAARAFHAGVSSSLNGWCAGGGISTLVKTSFTTEVSSDLTSALTSNRTQLGGLSEGGMKGYFSGGTTFSEVTTTDLLSFSTDSVSAKTTADLSTTRRGVGSFSDIGL
jgi:hypothetical protein